MSENFRTLAALAPLCLSASPPRGGRSITGEFLRLAANGGAPISPPEGEMQILVEEICRTEGGASRFRLLSVTS